MAAIELPGRSSRQQKLGFHPEIVLRAANGISLDSKEHLGGATFCLGVGGYLIAWFAGVLNVIFILMILDGGEGKYALQGPVDESASGTPDFGKVEIWDYASADFQADTENEGVLFGETDALGGYEEEHEHDYKAARFVIVWLCMILFPQAWSVLWQAFNLCFKARKYENGTYGIGGFNNSMRQMANLVQMTFQVILVGLAFGVFDQHCKLQQESVQIEGGFKLFQCVLAFTILMWMRAILIVVLVDNGADDWNIDVVGAKYEETQRLKSTVVRLAAAGV